MRTLRSWIWRLGGLFHKGRRDLDFAEELDSHLRLYIEDNVRAGLAPNEARRQAVIALGGIEQTKENYRDRRGLPFLEAVIQDVRFGMRLGPRLAQPVGRYLVAQEPSPRKGSAGGV
jgi:macrolide transport system ATP-binding/permease protein